MPCISTDILLMCLSSGWCLIFAGVFIRSFHLCIRRTFCGYEEERISSVEEEEEGEETSQHNRTMSSTRRQEKIDSLREAALLRYLNRFTLTLGDEHLLCLNGSEKETDTTLSSSTSKDNDEDESVKSNESCIDMERSGDVEEGSGDVNVVVICNEGDMTLDDSKQTTADDNAVEYTHVSLPLPGCDVTGIDICSIETAQECGRQEEGKRLELSSVDPSLIQSGVNDESETGETSQTEPVTITNNPNSQPQTVLKRSVPISCAICLLEYEKGDRVCWSSNAECSHVFHEDCILQWLVSLGKKSPINQYLYYTRNPRDKELLNDELCPCCRQDFICVKPASLGSEERV